MEEWEGRREEEGGGGNGREKERARVWDGRTNGEGRRDGVQGRGRKGREGEGEGGGEREGRAEGGREREGRTYAFDNASCSGRTNCAICARQNRMGVWALPRLSELFVNLSSKKNHH